MTIGELTDLSLYLAVSTTDKLITPDFQSDLELSPGLALHFLFNLAVDAPDIEPFEQSDKQSQEFGH
jgi:hypothetical protein